MLSRIIPIEDLRQRSVMFWLPPGGRHNEVWADTWMLIAELEPADSQPALDLLGDNDIGAYIASPTGRKGAPSVGTQLYVDREQQNKAADVLMRFLRKKDQPAMPRQERIGLKVRAKLKIPAMPRAVSIALHVVFFAALIAGALTLVYLRGASMFPGVHPVKHPAPASHAPGITVPTWTDPAP